MQRTGRLPSAALPSLGVVLAAGLLLAVALSIVVEPPRADGPGELMEALAWMRAALFSAGAIAFVVALILFVRGAGTAGITAAIADSTPSERPPRRPPFTVLALGGSDADVRAISDASDARQAMETLCAWSESHPEENVVILAPNGEPLAFRRSVPAKRVRRRGAA